jgi:hypothetical protein
MKLTKNTLIFIGILIFLLLLGPYFLTFNGQFSNNAQDWAHFGTYIGGTLGPIGAFLAFWGLVQQNKMYRENAEAEHLRDKLASLDSEILSIATQCYKIIHLGIHDVRIDSARLLVTDDPTVKKELIQEKIKDDNVTAKNAKLTGTSIKSGHENYRVLMSLESKLILMNKFISTPCVGIKNEASHYNDKYQYLLKEMNKKGWIDFTSFGN